MPIEIKTMKFKEMLTGIDFDVDVCDDYIDDLDVAFCPPLALTDNGREAFKDILDLDVRVCKSHSYACVLLNDKENCDELHRMLYDFLWGAAGYISDDEWNELFYYPDDEDYEDDVSEVGFNPYMGAYDYDC